MPGPDITRPKSKGAGYIILLSWAIWAGVLIAALAQPVGGHAAWEVSQAQSQPATSSQLSTSAPPAPAGSATSKDSQSGVAPASSSQQTSQQQSNPQKPSQRQSTEENGTFVIRKDVDEVLLHATVVDDRQRIVTNLDKTDFSVFEDGKPQTIISFHHEDIPVSMGILIDNSGSMREKRSKVNQAALNLVRSSNPQDEVFVVNFNDEYYLDQDFTNDLLKLKEALEKIDAKGGTALYEAVVASADHLKRDAKLERKVLFVVTDGEDNASRETLEQAVKQLQEENGPSVYAIGILGDEEHPKRARRALEIITQRTGGLAFFPKTLDEVDEISRQVAHDIRNQYTIGYKSTNPRSSGGFRQIRVEAKAKGHGKMSVRTKSGYYAGTQTAAAGAK
ncbi:MAG TPA: VWA domain-containing protein [Candidatus Sulfotelmatobacter sp.]|jgi:VWFA-related protein|nr:VWA domain-containing protein [Candidatus Sulfotelmatobacter sp.]